MAILGTDIQPRNGVFGSMKRGHVWLGAGISVVALVLAFWQVDLEQMGAAFARVDYGLVIVAAGIQLLVMGAIAGRWGLLFRQRPPFKRLLNALLIAQLANGVIPVRLGMFVRAYLVAREERQSKIMVFTTVVAEKVFDSLAFVLLFVAVLPVFAPGWFQWSAFRLSTVLFAVLFPGLVLVTYQRHRVLRLVRGLMGRVPWMEKMGLVQKFEAGLEGLARLRGGSTLVQLWGWTLVIAGLGVLVNYAVLRAFAVPVPWGAAVFLLVALQIGGKVLAAPLGGIGVFQYICVEALALFGVDRELALSYGFVLHFVVFVPGILLGALALYRAHYSLRWLESEAQDAIPPQAPQDNPDPLRNPP
jgi:glycosyltransferase 2 family protein